MGISLNPWQFLKIKIRLGRVEGDGFGIYAVAFGNNPS